jgi:hypothetical protein
MKNLHYGVLQFMMKNMYESWKFQNILKSKKMKSKNKKHHPSSRERLNIPNGQLELLRLIHESRWMVAMWSPAIKEAGPFLTQPFVSFFKETNKLNSSCFSW